LGYYHVKNQGAKNKKNTNTNNIMLNKDDIKKQAREIIE
jgi:hypothetical protein